MNTSRTRASKRLAGVVNPAVLSFALLVVATLWLPNWARRGSAEAATVGVMANRTIPALPPPPAFLTFSENPGDAEFLRAGVSNEPLVPAGRTRPAENRDLASALRAYDADRRAGALDAVEPLVAFLSRYPDTAWRPSLLVSLGTAYRRGGHFSKALEAWQSAWDAARDLDGAGRAIGDSALAKLSQFEAYLGRKELLGPLLDSVRDRPLHGAAAELVIESRRGLADMLDRPGSSFRCGPLALERILLSQNASPPKASFSPLEAARSTPNGLSLSSVAALSEKAGMHYQMAFRTPGAEVIVPAVVHWKVGHYAALVGRPDARFQVEDATFGESIRISEQTLDEEASGYFLVPPGPLPAGWRAASTIEGDSVWGRGDTGSNKDNGATGPDLFDAISGGGCGGCTSWNVELSVVGLQLHDIPVGYTPPVGPKVQFELYYSHRDVLQPQTFSYTNFGPKWTTTWLSYVTNGGGGSVDLYRRGGGDEPYTFPGTSANVSVPGQFSQAILTQEVDGDGNPTSFTRQLKDGTVEKFTLAMGNQFFMTSVVDPQGNTVTIKYDDKMRIVAIVDAVGQVTTLEYGLASDPLKVTQVKDPFGRAATFAYTADGSFLASITDTLGIKSSYAYSSGDLIKELTTPYGTTSFVAVDDVNNNDQRYLTITDTLGRVSHVEFQQAPPGSQDTDLPSGSPIPTGLATTDGLMEWRNTYIFDATQYKLASGSSGLDFSKARLIHWLHTLDDSTSRIPESTKQPLENRLWYDYQGEASSIYVGTTNQAWHSARVLDDGSTELWTYAYNPLGNLTKAIDPAGRTYQYEYDSTGVNLLYITNTTGGMHDVLYKLTYNGQHEPLTIVAANGATTQYEYNALGQMTKRTDADGSVTTYGYKDDYLTSVEGPLGATYSLTYDSFGRLATATDPGGETVKYEYDAADRLTKAAFPDGTAGTFSYSLLDFASSTDRLGHKTVVDHDSEREIVRVADPLGETVTFDYNLGGKLISLKDGNGHETQLVRDEQERLTAKKYADGTAHKLAYEQTTSRVHSKTDALGQKTTYAYNSDDTLKAVSYMDARVATPNVSYTYDPAYRRRTGMTDGTGTTKYDYFPVSTSLSLGANQLRSVTSPVAGAAGVADTVSYTYDALNRPTAQGVDGTVESWGYDALSRTTSAKNALDAFVYGYADATARVSGVTSARGPKSVLAYFGAQGDELVQELTFKTSGGSLLSHFAYKYDADDDVTSFTQSYVGQAFAGAAGGDGGAGFTPAALEGPKRGRGSGNDDSSKLAELLGMGAGLLLLAWSWARRRPESASRLAPAAAAPVLLALLFIACGSDHGGGASAQVTGYTYDAAGRLVSAVVGTDVSTPSVPGFKYGYDSASNLTSMTAAGSEMSSKYTATNAFASGTYDANGSPKALNGATYTWDAANRIATATGGGSESEFSYDGASRLVRVVTKQAGKVATDTSYTWCGIKRCLGHDNLKSGSPVSTRYFDQGVQIGGQTYYYVKDRLGSVRQLVDTSGAVRAQYDYDPYGVPTKISGDLDSDVGFTGALWNPSSGLAFAMHRAYDARSTRWLNRDPMGEAGGINLYAYARGNPINVIDPSGLCFIDIGVSGGFGFGGAVGVQIGTDDSGGVGIHPYAGVGITTPTLGVSYQASGGNISSGWSAQAQASAGPVTGSVSTSGSGDPTVEGGYGVSIGPPGSVGIYGIHTW
jgi:RHS repeat-associated protein